MTSFSLQVLTNKRYFCRLSKKRKLVSGSAFGAAGVAACAGRAPPLMSGISSGGESPAPEAPFLVMKSFTRCSVSGVTRAPSRRRATNFPSFTARRPKVDSAMPGRRQKSEMLPSSVPPPGTASSVTGLQQNGARANGGRSTTHLAVRKVGCSPPLEINGFSRPPHQGFGERPESPDNYAMPPLFRQLNKEEYDRLSLEEKIVYLQMLMGDIREKSDETRRAIEARKVDKGSEGS